MTTYYVGKGGNDGNAGTSWATRKLTLNGAEDIPVVAGDTVYVGAGTYEELLTVDVSGSSGNYITYIADYRGDNTDGVGGLVRVTGSWARGNCISANGKDYRTFRGFLFGESTTHNIYLTGDCSYWYIEDCAFNPCTYRGVHIESTSDNVTIRRCWFNSQSQGYQGGVQLEHSSENSSSHVIENCIFMCNRGQGIYSNKVAAFTVRNCTFIGGQNQIEAASSLTGTITVNNCQFVGGEVALKAAASGDIIEDYNNFYACATNRTNVSTGGNSTANPPYFDTMWFHELSHAGRMVSPWDYASWSGFIDLNDGSSPPTQDMRQTSELGSYKEWGALEYDGSLLYKSDQLELLNAIVDKLPDDYIMGSSVQTAKDDEIDAILVDTGTTLDGAIATIDGLVDQIIAKLPTNYIMGSSVQTDKDDEIDAIKSKTDLLTLAAIADAVWDEAISGHTGAGSFGEGMDDITYILGDVLTLAAIADAVWDEYISGHIADTNSAGYYLSLTTQRTGTLVSDVTDLLDGWNGDTHQYLLAIATELMGTYVTGDLFAAYWLAQLGDIDAILVDTGTDIPGTLTDIHNTLDDVHDDVTNKVDEVKNNLDIVDGIVDAILVDTGTTIPASIAAIAVSIAALPADVWGYIIEGTMTAHTLMKRLWNFIRTRIRNDDTL